jgi:hypothetical protein
MIGFESDEAVLQKLREWVTRITDDELIQFGKSVAIERRPNRNIERQLEEAGKLCPKEDDGALLFLFSPPLRTRCRHSRWRI